MSFYAIECSSPSPVPGYNSGPIGYTGTEQAKESTCQGYLCVDGRCRSCTSAEQCYDAVGLRGCYSNGHSPGQRCGDEPPAGSEFYQPVDPSYKEGDTVAAVAQEDGMPNGLQLQIPAGTPVPAGSHLGVIWWNQRVGEPDPFMRIAYDAAIDASTRDLTLAFAAMTQPAEQNLLCWRDCRDPSICACDPEEVFALASIVVAVDRDGDGALSLDELRIEQVGGTPVVIGWAPVAAQGVDNLILQEIHQGFATYAKGAPTELYQALTTTTDATAALAFCDAGNASCSFAVPLIFCHTGPGTCDNSGLDRFGL